MMEILSRCGQSTLRVFRPSCLNNRLGSVLGQLISVEHNRLTVSVTVSIDEPAGGYLEMVEYKNSARGHLIALENKGAMEGYLEETIQGTTMKQKAYGTLVSSEMHAESIDQLVSLPWSAVRLRHFDEEIRMTPKILALIAIPNVRMQLQLRLTREENDSEEKKISKKEKTLLMTSVRDLMTNEAGWAAVPCAKRRYALCFFRFMLEQISVPAVPDTERRQ